MGLFTPPRFNLDPVGGGANTGFGGPLSPGPGSPGTPVNGGTPGTSPYAYNGTNNYYTGNMGGDVNNYLNHYPSDHTVFSGFDASGNPTGVNPLFDVGTPQTVGTGADFGKAEDYAGDLSHVVYNPDGSYNTADSPLAQGQLAQLATGYQNSVDQTEKNTSGQLANGLSSLAMTGGMDSGARNRMVQSSDQAGGAALQGGVNQYQQGQQAIRTNDANYKAGIQQQLPGLYQGLDQYSTGNQFRDVGNKMNADSFNAGVAGGGLNNMNDFDMNKYTTGGQVLGSTYATEAMGGGGLNGANPYNPYSPSTTGPVSDASRSSLGGQTTGILQSTPLVGNVMAGWDTVGNWAHGDFSQNDNQYENIIPGVNTWTGLKQANPNIKNPKSWFGG